MVVLSQLAASPGSGVARLIFFGVMVSAGNQGLGLNDKLLRHYKEEVTEMALGILDGKPFDSPVHEGILLTCMLELLPYDDSDKSESSQERFHSYLSELNDEIIEERRRTEPPEPESPNQTLMQIQQTLGQLAGQMNEISRTVQRQGEILNSARCAFPVIRNS